MELLKLLDRTLEKLKKKSLTVNDVKSLDIDYLPPRVYRVWFEMHDEELNINYRVMFHRIFKLQKGEKPYYHPHIWKSAMIVCEGSYIMELGDANNIYSTMLLTPKSKYEMVNPNGWHSVSPLTEIADSIMITTELYPKVEMPVKHPTLNPLEEHTVRYLLRTFKNNYFNINNRNEL